MKVSEASVALLSAVMLRRAGHALSTDRHYRIESSLGPVLRARGFASVDALTAAMKNGRDERLETEVFEALLNNETYFFRDNAPFDLAERFLDEKLRPARPKQRICIWCVGVSTGQEAYSLAMLLEEQAAKWPGWHFDIIGSDISAMAIERARSGVYTQFEVQRGLSARRLITHFEQSGVDWRIAPGLRRRVQFQCLDVTRDSASVHRPDIIFCRNLLLYLPLETRREVFARLHGALAPDGALVLGAAETILGQTDAFDPDPLFRGLYRPRNLSTQTASRFRLQGQGG